MSSGCGQKVHVICRLNYLTIDLRASHFVKALTAPPGAATLQDGIDDVGITALAIGSPPRCAPGFF